MYLCKPVITPLASHFKLSDKTCPKTENEKRDMANIPYRMAIASVMYSMISTRPDIAFSISLLSRFMSNPGRDHWAALKWLLHYLNGTLGRGLHYYNWSGVFELIGYVDSDFAGDKDGRKSTTSYFFTIAGNCVS